MAQQARITKVDSSMDRHADFIGSRVRENRRFHKSLFYFKKLGLLYFALQNLLYCRTILRVAVGLS
ncbi:hypothetical protein [Helicobacter canis]|uniref:hypothetical protein n=1 Tax=Helicobacter canis TaxID=29419 RepID=UPI0011C01B17|nr:hypothetical protein [Helicobacter canis]